MLQQHRYQPTPQPRGHVRADTGTNAYPDSHGDGPSSDADPSTDKQRPDAGSNSPETSAHVGFHEARGNTNNDAADQHPNAGSHPDAGSHG